MKVITRQGSAARKRIVLSQLESVVRDVAAEYRTTPAIIRSRYRGKLAVEARWEAWRRLAKPTTSVISIARAWPCNHTTILSALEGGKRTIA